MDTELVLLTSRDDSPLESQGVVALTSISVVDFGAVSAAQKAKWWKPHWGTVAQWVGAIGSIFAILLTLHFHAAESASKSSDDHINTLIGEKLTPAENRINGNIETKIGPINAQLEDLNRKLGQIQGKLGIFTSNQKKIDERLNQQASLARVIDPNRILGVIQTDIQRAASGASQPIPRSILADYKETVRALNPDSSSQYWKTVAAIINYQSQVNQLSGAPDPAKVSHPCPGLTAGRGGNNVFENIPISNCILDLDTTHNVLSGAVVTNSVVRYHGGAVALHNVLFVNCTFILDLPSSTEPAQPTIFLTILNSPDQKQVRISTHS